MDRNEVLQVVLGGLLVFFGLVFLWAVWMAHRPFKRRKPR